WPLPSMAPLALSLALLAKAVAAATTTRVLPLDMSPSSFDDQYQGCVPAMTAALSALNRSEFQNNPLFAQAWAKAAAAWRGRESPLSPLSPEEAIAIVAYTMYDIKLYREFNAAVRTAGSSRREYWDNFQYNTLHFLLTQALGTLRDTQKEQKCHDVFRGVGGIRFEAQPGDEVRFGQFASTSLDREVAQSYGNDTVFEVHTCHGVDIQDFSYDPEDREVLIPPFETFLVTDVTREGDKARIQLHSARTYSNYNCEWLRGDNTGDSTGDS
ncbi:NARE ribosyltransferase, partial [Certhia familiaris]|nr:NARE ribosyltransferase [Certhia familiaris]